MIVTAFEILLKQTIGLDVCSVGRSTIEHAVRGRLVACNLNDFQDYWVHLTASKAELQELVEAVVVPEQGIARLKVYPESFDERAATEIIGGES